MNDPAALLAQRLIRNFEQVEKITIPARRCMTA